jgi:RES domain-containing protein
VPLDGLLIPWSDYAYRHIPEGSSYDVLDFRFAGRGLENRWNYPRQPTLYLARDAGVAVAEFGRHLDENRAPALRSQVQARQLYRVQVRVERLLDLREASIQGAISIANAPHCFLTQDIARATANYIRATTSAQAILVPSMAFLDQPERWVSVLFLEKLPNDVRAFILSVERDGAFRLQP